MSYSQSNPFNNIFKMFDPSQMSNFYSTYKNTPITDVNNMAEMQKENIKTLNQTTQAMVETGQKIINSNSEMMQNSATDLYNLFRDIDYSNPIEIVSKQAEALKKTIENCASHMQEISEMTFRSSSDILSSLSKRASECVDDTVSCSTNNSQTHTNTHSNKKKSHASA